jgi:hypothetical protein
MNTAKKQKLDDFRLSFDDLLGWKWQDKRNGEALVYDRYFATPWDLRCFLRETFGARAEKSVCKSHPELP